ncbi:phosphorylase [Candidatus Gracilibacteria bacterium]|jgi:sulfate adenylyltransferase (ADP) / ATP adenylyltransferase|nr:phosphorylase [Candidatus Gracilibacteria bacterium]NJP19874.1 phosphorylase [Hydrococcus sp. CRU_1_1]
MLKQKQKESKLWSRAIAQTKYALECGSLETIATDYQFIEQNGINFLVRILSNLVRKDEAKKKQKEFNPFLPYEKDLFVADLSDTHVCILNKYNVVPHHLLIITRDFEEQESWLTIQDFEALWTTLAEVDGLAFYNGGKTAGASQRHKHLQLAPFPLVPNGASLPIEPALLFSQCQNTIEVLPTLPFVHAFTKLNPAYLNSPSEAARMTLECYTALLKLVGLPFEGDRQTGAYNLLITREWMLLIPRSQESFESIAVNSLGFAGALLVRNQQQLDLLKQQSPMKILANVAFEK